MMIVFSPKENEWTLFKGSVLVPYIEMTVYPYSLVRNPATTVPLK
jgi:hypothetical protein